MKACGAGKQFILDTLEDIMVLPVCSFRILFFSFQWLSWAVPRWRRFWAGPSLRLQFRWARPSRTNFAGQGPLKPSLTCFTFAMQLMRLGGAKNSCVVPESFNF